MLVSPDEVVVGGSCWLLGSRRVVTDASCVLEWESACESASALLDGLEVGSVLQKQGSNM